MIWTGKIERHNLQELGQDLIYKDQDLKKKVRRANILPSTIDLLLK